MALVEYMKGTGELAGSFDFSASLNGTAILSGQAGGEANQASPTAAMVPVSSLFPSDPNGLVIERSAGPGRLYYNVSLNVARPVESVAPVENGLSVSRAYYLLEEDCTFETCEPVNLPRWAACWLCV